jgi:hypothetical protein
MPSPYARLPQIKWKEKTHELIASHPLQAVDIREAVLDSWDSIFESKIGKHRIQIGKDIFPIPQLMGAFLHELIPLELAAKYPKVWRGNQNKGEKDLVYITDLKFSIEIKTSSNKSAIFANRSYAQPQSTSPLAKGKDGYYIAVNFEKFKLGQRRPRILLIRFGWLDHTDWIAQSAATGQQARLAPITYQTKLLPIYDAGSDDGPVKKRRQRGKN